MNFKDIIGQEEIINSLKNAIACDKVGHAFIFSGPLGIGKRTIANIFASILLCENKNTDSTCGACQSCKLFEADSNPDFHIISTEGLSIGVDEIRNIQRDVAIKPMYSKKKVYIIEDAEKMTAQAQNCLLKTLEEPPSYAVIILTVSNYEALLETVRSRSCRLSFKKNSYEQVRQALIQKFGNDVSGIDFAALYADGIIGRALEIAGTSEFLLRREKTFKILNELISANSSNILSVIEYFEDNRDDINLVFDIMLAYYRDMVVFKKTGNENILINSDKKDIIFNNVEEYRVNKLMENIEHIEATRRAIKQNANYLLAIECMLLKLQKE